MGTPAAAMTFPDGRQFAFTIFDDTDRSTVANTGPVYRFLADLGMRTTKSVWVYRPRGSFSGECLLDPEYRDWILKLQAEGFEIALHNVGDGAFSTSEIRRALAIYEAILGECPRLHANHSQNPDNLYWWSRRFEPPLNWLYTLARMVRRRGAAPLGGHDPASPHFWGDLSLKHIQYVRNLCFAGINTLAYDPAMPYRRERCPLVNAWLSSSDGSNPARLTALLDERHVDALEEAGGVCIVYTHLGLTRGRLDATLERRLHYLASRPGWFVPVGTVLDHLASQHGHTDDPGYRYRLRLNLWWLAGRLIGARHRMKSRRR